MIDHGAPYISAAQAEFEEAAKQWQQQAAHASAQAAKYSELARVMHAVYRDAIALSTELGD